ncbi:unnamed protein product [Rhizoctonia solani]|uniref:Uncharacterized protein n=1 Tax=Rhizoctonia solani TaxID=456999 RepID=A0A8H2ZZH7_9AGAM|nr:unnamed protein product [Rhizoctonia solani]
MGRDFKAYEIAGWKVDYDEYLNYLEDLRVCVIRNTPVAPNIGDGKKVTWSHYGATARRKIYRSMEQKRPILKAFRDKTGDNNWFVRDTAQIYLSQAKTYNNTKNSKGREVYMRRNRDGGQAAAGNKGVDSDSEEEKDRHKGNISNSTNSSSHPPPKSNSRSKSSVSSNSKTSSDSNTSRSREARRADRIVAEEEARARSQGNENTAKGKQPEKLNGLHPKKKEIGVKKAVKKTEVSQSESDTDMEEGTGVTLDPELKAIRDSAQKTSKKTSSRPQAHTETQDNKRAESTHKSTRVYNKRKKGDEDHEDHEDDEERVTGPTKRSRRWPAPGSVEKKEKDDDGEHEEAEVEPDPTPRPARPLTPVPEEDHLETGKSPSQAKRNPTPGTSGRPSASSSEPTHTTGVTYLKRKGGNPLKPIGGSPVGSRGLLFTVGATKATQSAVETSDSFAESMHWQSYRAELLEAYQLAAAERGTGSVARQKKLFHDHIEASRGTIFSKGTDALFSKLDQAAEQIGVLLELGLNELAEKVEVSMSVLWDIPKAGNEETKRRRDLIQHLDDMLHQLELWLEACNAGIGNTFNRSATEIGANDFPGKDNGLVNLVMSNLLDGASVATLADNDEEHDTEGDEDDGEGDEEDELRDEEFDEGDPYYGMYY